MKDDLTALQHGGLIINGPFYVYRLHGHFFLFEDSVFVGHWRVTDSDIKNLSDYMLT